MYIKPAFNLLKVSFQLCLECICLAPCKRAVTAIAIECISVWHQPYKGNLKIN